MLKAVFCLFGNWIGGICFLSEKQTLSGGIFRAPREPSICRRKCYIQPNIHNNLSLRLNIMEDNNNIDANAASTSCDANTGVEPQTKTESDTASEATPKTASETVSQYECAKPIHRKNGRNRSISGGVQRTNAVRENCGEISDISAFKEKLSGSNVSGYGNSSQTDEKPERKRQGDRRDRFSRRDRKQDFSDGESSSTDQPSEVAQAEGQHNGPSFETQVQKDRPVEVRLHDRRVRPHAAETKIDEGVISYSATECSCPPISLFARFKNAVAAIFGKKDSKKKKFSNSRKGFKGNRDNKKFRGMDGKRRFDNNRRGHGNFNPKGRNFHKHDGNRGGNSAPKAD